MSTGDKEIADVLAQYGEPFAGNVWRVQGRAVIYHKALERIAAQAKITWDVPTVVRAEQGDVAILVIGRTGERMEWSIGEAWIGTNYRVSGKQAAYPFAMAEKRAKDRVILKLIELSGVVYSEEEADEFKDGRPRGDDIPDAEDPDGSAENRIAADLKAKIDRAKSINAVTDLMLHADTQRALSNLEPPFRDEIRDYGKRKLMSLGWPGKKAA